MLSLSDVVIIFSSNVVLTSNGQFFNCAITAFSERYVTFYKPNAVVPQKTSIQIKGRLKFIKYFVPVTQFCLPICRLET